MSLKRKASYPAMAPSNGPALAAGLDDTPRHLNSRTRKRFRNDRPSDEVVYGENWMADLDRLLRHRLTRQKTHSAGSFLLSSSSKTLPIPTTKI